MYLAIPNALILSAPKTLDIFLSGVKYCLSSGSLVKKEYNFNENNWGETAEIYLYL